jgi:2-polyprenyl-3-methyl-5-hydroxy-6-metoxy-1,4-benzoquinol methylase
MIRSRMVAVLFPRFDYPAIEERYASWQSQMLLRRDEDIELAFYDIEEPASVAAGLVESDHALVVTDPLLIPPQHLATRLRELLVHTPEAVAALPVSNEAQHPRQRRSPATPYMTLRELQQVSAEMQKAPTDADRVRWDKSDPGAYLCRTAFLEEADDPPRSALYEHEVVISANDYVHRWIRMRAEMRHDLLPMIPLDAKSVIEFGCGEASLGEALKKRQPCRVVGVEVDPAAAAVARKRIDDVYCGDAQHIISIIGERFDCIIGSELVEHIGDPWSLLADMRRICNPAGRLLLSIPNIASASLINDLLIGRFDYTYIGLTCVGHIRFFTRRTIEDMLRMTGWQITAITPQFAPSAAADDLRRRLEAANITVSHEDLAATGFYVIAQNTA